MSLFGGLVAGAMQGGGEAGVKVGLAEQEALIQQERASRLADLQKEMQGTQITATRENVITQESGANTRALDRQKFDTGENKLNRDERSKEFDVRNKQDERQHQERMTALNKQLQQQSAQIGLESRKLSLLESNNLLDQEDKKVVRDARKAYSAETDPAKKAELGAQYLTLIGKIGERWKPIESVDPNTNVKTITGWYDGLTGRQLGKGGLVGGAQGDPMPPPKVGDVVDGAVFKGGDPRDKNNWKPVKAAPQQSGSALYGSSGSHDASQPSASSKSAQERISELQSRLDNNVNTTLEGKRRDETELQMLVAKRNERYTGASTYDPNKPAIWNK